MNDEANATIEAAKPNKNSWSMPVKKSAAPFNIAPMIVTPIAVPIFRENRLSDVETPF